MVMRARSCYCRRVKEGLFEVYNRRRIKRGRERKKRKMKEEL